MKKFGYRPTSGGYSGRAVALDRKASIYERKSSHSPRILLKRIDNNSDDFVNEERKLPKAPVSGSAQVKIKE